MFQIIKPGTVIPFMKIAKPVEVLMIVLVVACIFSVCTKGLNLGLDFTGGEIGRAHV